MDFPDDQQLDGIDGPSEEVGQLPKAYLQEGKLMVPRGAVLPTDICVCCTRKPRKVISKALRNPKNPTTWFGNTTSLEIGLCKKHGEAYNVALALTFSLLGLGVFIFAAGLYSISGTAIVPGAIALSICGLFRARLPITSPNPNSELVEVHGAGAVILSRFPVVTPVEVKFTSRQENG